MPSQVVLTDGSFVNQLQAQYGINLPALLGALGFLLVGWVVATLASSAVRALLQRFNTNQHINRSTGKSHDLESMLSRLVFWVIMVMAVIGALDALNLPGVAAPLSGMLGGFFNYLPNLIGAVLIGVAAWVIASLARASVVSLADKSKWHADLQAKGGARQPVSQNLGQLVYWLILLLALPLILSTLQINGLLTPVNAMLTNALGYIPNILGAGLIAVVGFMIARIARGLVTNVVAQLPLEKWFKAGKHAIDQETHAGTTTTQTISPIKTPEQAASQGNLSDNIANIAGLSVFLLILIPTIIAALDQLHIRAISQPAIQMLNGFTAAIPNILGAALLLGIFWFVSRMIAGIVTNLLDNTAVNQLPQRMGMPDLMGRMRVSEVVGHAIVLFAMLMATVAAANMLGFAQISGLVTRLIQFGSNVLLGAVVMVVGFWLANLLGNVVKRSHVGNAEWLGTLVKALVIGLVLAMGLNAMGIADSIVNLAFGLTLGAVAVAFALAFGLGGRKAADRMLQKWMDKAETQARITPPSTTTTHSTTSANPSANLMTGSTTTSTDSTTRSDDLNN